MKPNNLFIEDLTTVLNAEDKAYCDELFQKYEAFQKLTSEIFKEGGRNIFEYNEACKGNHPFAKESGILTSHMNKVASLLKESSKSLVIQIEKYFRKKYSLDFPSLLKTHPYEVNHALTEYNAVIANMINQTGTGFSQVTREGAFEAAPSFFK